MAKRNGSSIKILSDGITITNLQNVGLSVNGAMIDVTTKDSAGWKEVIPGLKSGTMTGSGIVDFSAAFPPSTIFTKLAAGTSCAVIFYDSIVADKSYTCSGYYSKLDYKAGTEDNFTFDFTVEITAAITQAATT